MDINSMNFKLKLGLNRDEEEKGFHKAAGQRWKTIRNWEESFKGAESFLSGGENFL